jgi:hypothetical protein
MKLLKAAAVICSVMIGAAPVGMATETPNPETDDQQGLVEKLNVATNVTLSVEPVQQSADMVAVVSDTGSTKNNAIYLLAGAFLGLAYLSRLASRPRP